MEMSEFEFSNLTGRVVCLANRGASRLLRRAAGRCRAARMPPTLPFAGAGTSGPRPSLTPPPPPPTELLLILQFTADWTAPAAPAPPAAARSGTAPSLRTSGATVSAMAEGKEYAAQAGERPPLARAQSGQCIDRRAMIRIEAMPHAERDHHRRDRQPVRGQNRRGHHAARLCEKSPRNELRTFTERRSHRSPLRVHR